MNRSIEPQLNRYQQVESMSKIGSWEWNITENKVCWSDEIYLLFNVSPKNFMARYEHYLSFLTPASVRIVTDRVQSILTDHQLYCHCIELLNGRVLDGRGFLITNDDGQPAKLYCTIQAVNDILALQDQLNILQRIVTEQNEMIGVFFITHNKILFHNFRLSEFWAWNTSVFGKSSVRIFLHNKTNGNGIGLSFVTMIIDQHQGSTTLTSKEDQDACFCIQLALITVNEATQ